VDYCRFYEECIQATVLEYEYERTRRDASLSEPSNKDNITCEYESQEETYPEIGEEKGDEKGACTVCEHSTEAGEDDQVCVPSGVDHAGEAELVIEPGE